MFLHGCPDRQDLVFCFFQLKNPPMTLPRASQLEKIFSMGINCMSLAVWLGEDRKCSAAVVGLTLVLGLPILRRCSLNRSFKRRYKSISTRLYNNGKI